MRIEIKKFKKIEYAALDFSSVNVLIGTNNSGKSSFIQGIQFAISSFQSLELRSRPWSRKHGARTLSLDSSEFLYTPTRYIENLYNGEKLTGAKTRGERKKIEFLLEQDDKSVRLEISRGKNGGFTTTQIGRELGTIASSLNNPFCVYVPGIAGIPIEEKYEVPIVIKKTATRGDSNNYLRNIIWNIKGNKDKWERFHSSVNKVYPNIVVHGSFDENISENIDIQVEHDNIRLPLDSIGTGVLQTIQIFAYLEYFEPKIILLDEPDSHIHPTKQKLIARELKERTETQEDLIVVFSTHSRYILDELQESANVIHFQKGKPFSGIKDSKILLDIGAADADYLFAKQNLKYIIATEDKTDNIEEKKAFLKKFIIANGLSEDEFVLHSYEGSTKVDFAKILEGFVRKQIPGVKVIVHVDRDQRNDDDKEIVKLREDCVERDIILFITEFCEIENYFCSPEHISKVFNIELDEAKSIIAFEVGNLKNESLRKLQNFILRSRKEDSYNKDGQTDIAVVLGRCEERYLNNEFRFTPGKELLGRLKNYAQNVLGKNPQSVLDNSIGLKRKSFVELLE